METPRSAGRTDVNDIVETSGVMALKLWESFKLLVEKTARSCDYTKVQDCFAGHTGDQQIAGCYKFKEMIELFVEATMDEFHDLCVEKKMYESLGRFHRLCQLQGVEEQNGKLVATRPLPGIVQPDQVALEERLVAKVAEVETLTELVIQLRLEKNAVRDELSQKQADAEEVLNLLSTGSEAAMQIQQEALIIPSRRQAIQQRRDVKRQFSPAPV